MSLKFRPDIEGLRAIAILLVVAAHAKIRGFAGGFVGVDVFFVLSGYLITGLLIQELLADGRIRFVEFFARRFRRLFPSLLLVLACSCVLAQQLLVVDEQSGQATAAASAIVWLSNFYFAFSEFDYFSPDAGKNLFLHTWSLGVEEQFYLVWPVLLLVVGKAFRPLNGGINLGHVKIIMTAIAVLGFIGCAVWTDVNQLQAFYMMPARAWQFALGATVYLYLNNSSPGAKLKKWLFGSGWLGLLAILATALILDREARYPGVWAALPSLGTAAVLASGVHLPQGGVGRLLSLPPLQSLGRISYVWYLWHWPILLLGTAVIVPDGIGVRIGLVVVSLILAILSHVLVESPLRNTTRFPLSAPRILAGTVALMIATNGLAIRWYNDTQREIEKGRQQPYAQARRDAPAIYSMGCDDWYQSDAVRVCEFGSSDSDKIVVAVGDSIALQWFPAIKAAFVPRGWRLLVITKSSCPMVDEPIFYKRIGRRYDVCERWRKSALELLAQLKPQIVIMGSTYTYSFNETQWREGTTRILKSLTNSAKQTYILHSTPVLPFDAPSCLAPRGWLFRQLANPNRCTAPINHDRRDDVHRWLESASAAFKNVEVIDMTDAICSDGLCRARQNGLITFRDTQHLSASFARSLSGELANHLHMSGVNHER